jgi:hypothetical protein
LSETRLDLEIAAGARASDVLWRERPLSRAYSDGDVEVDESTERGGAPAHPKPGRHYKDVVRGWRLAAILREALSGRRS